MKNIFTPNTEEPYEETCRVSVADITLGFQPKDRGSIPILDTIINKRE